METNKPRLHGYWRSSCTWRLRILLNWKGIDYEYVPVNLLEGAHKQPAYLEINPAGMVPAFEIDGHVFTESMPICEYLEETRTECRKLYPEDPYQRF